MGSELVVYVFRNADMHRVREDVKLPGLAIQFAKPSMK